MNPPPRVELVGLSKSYAGVYALREVSFAIQPGRVHALIGENGAGKSTLVKILAGALRADAGTIRMDGEPVDIKSVRAARQLGISLVHQELNLVPHLSVSDNIFLGRWPTKGGFFVQRHALAVEASRLLTELNLDVPVHARVEHLTVARQQMVEIAKALSILSRVLILDEPSAVLTPSELETLFRVVRDLTRRGTSVVYISHRLAEIFTLADDVTVLRDGQHISTRPIGKTDRQRLIREVVGRELTEEFPRRTPQAVNNPNACRSRRSDQSRDREGAVFHMPPTDVRGSDRDPSDSAGPYDAVLRVRRLTVAGRFSEVSLDLHAGEIFGLTGMVGSGRTSLAKAIFGALNRVAGQVKIGSHVGPFASPREAQRAGIAYVPEDRRREGLLLLRSLRENLTLAHINRHARAGLLRLRAERAASRELMSRLRIKAKGPESPAATLSGGNQQKSMLARWMIQPYPVIILDEPTRGVDVGAKAEIYELMNVLAASGTAILMISSELPEVIGMSDRIGVMSRGRLMGILDNVNRAVTQEQIMTLAIGVSE